MRARSSLLPSIAVAVAIALSSCSGVSSPSLATPPTQAQPAAAPTVVAVGTQTNGWATNRAIDVKFSDDMNPATVNSQTFLLQQSGVLVPGNVTYDRLNRIGLFKATSDLQPDTPYTATITTGAAKIYTSRLIGTNPGDFLEARF